MNNFIGVGQVLFFVVMSAVNGVFLSIFLVNSNIFSTLLCVFSLIALLFNIYILLRHGLQFRGFTRTVWLYIAFSNLTTTVNWFSFFFAVKYSEPAIAATLVNSVLPLATIGISATLLGQRNRRAAELWWAVALCVAMLMTAFVVFSGHSGRPATEIHAYVIGVAMSLLCGLSIAFNTVVSKKLNELDVSPSSIMAYRFFLLIALAGTIVDKHVLIENVQRFHWQIVMIAVIGNLIPLFALQSGIKRLNPVTVVFLNGLSPITFFLVQSTTGKFIFSVSSLCSVLFSTITILFGAYYSSRGWGQQKVRTAAALKETS
ncbi:EamA family transporter [Paraburkholderia megapolitana]|uniref:EamA family transporter n=1 Tax=Paraburkholderia megapolitana TaxID=420953 RepID=UPI0038B6E91C